MAAAALRHVAPPRPRQLDVLRVLLVLRHSHDPQLRSIVRGLVHDSIARMRVTSPSWSR